MRRHQSVRRGAWYMGGRRKGRTQTGGLLTVGALAAPILGTLGGVVIKKLFGGKRRRRRRQHI